MIGYRIDKMKGLFFDSARVVAATSRAERKVLSRFGAFVRRGARSSIRKRKAVSKPGQPPSSHAGLLKKFIFFAYEPNKQSVVIGPARLNKTTGDALPALEYGGRTKIVARRRQNRKVRTISIQARPFMGPAFEREKPKLPALWAGSVK